MSLEDHLEGRLEPQAFPPFRIPTAGSLQSWDERGNLSPREASSTKLQVGSHLLTKRRLPSVLSWQRIHLQCERPGFDSSVGKIRWRRDRLSAPVFLGFPCGSAGKESAHSVGDLEPKPQLGLCTEGCRPFGRQQKPWKELLPGVSTGQEKSWR